MPSHQRVLILEDDPHSRRLARVSVELALPDFESVLMSSVKEAAAHAESGDEPFSLCLLDAMLADGSIADAWPHLSHLCSNADKIIVISTMHKSALEPIVRDIPVTDVLQKPYSPDDLMALLSPPNL